MIKAVIFDFDGVLLKVEKIFSQRLAEAHNIPPEKIMSFFKGPYEDCRVGKADLKEAISPYLPAWGWDQGLDSLLDFWFRLEGVIDEELLSYLALLRAQGVVCILGTNNEKHRFQYILKEMGLEHHLDRAYSSGSLGHRKPDHEFFIKIINELENISKSEILFVDNDKENTKSAEVLGLQTELYTNLSNLKEKINSLNKS